MASDKQIPGIFVKGELLPFVWEQSLLDLWEQGAQIKTEYDKPENPPSKDSTCMMVIENPMKEPRLHRCFPGSIEDLYKYVEEVVNGVHDHWIRPDEGKWTYTYHQRLFNYYVLNDVKDICVNGSPPISPFPPVNQIQDMIEHLAKSNYTRRAQAITWIPTADPKTEDPPCLQRVWCRIIEVNDLKYLEMNTHWRSRDAYKAAFMNMFALTELQTYMAVEISKILKETVAVGRYIDISDSYHIYGSYFNEFQNSFMKLVNSRKPEGRVWSTTDKNVVLAKHNAMKILKEETK
jgi:thymidylate synthase